MHTNKFAVLLTVRPQAWPLYSCRSDSSDFLQRKGRREMLWP